MRTGTIAKWIALVGALVAFFAVLAFSPGARPRSAEATANPLPPLISCPTVAASPTGISVADILSVVKKFGINFGQPGYGPLWDLVSPYNSTSPAGTGAINVADILYVVQHFGQHCSLMETQIAIATRAISDPMFSGTYCDDAGAIKFQNPVNCGGSSSFLTEDVNFLRSKGYVRGSTDVPGQGIHYINMSLWDGLFNPARPEGLVYKSRADVGLCPGPPAPPGPYCSGPALLVAQLYYAEGDAVLWGPAGTGNTHAIQTDSFCTPVAGEPPGTGCSWSGTFDGWHFHQNLCTWAIDTPNAVAFPGPASQADCAATASGVGQPCTAFYPAAGWNCTWKAKVGWMGHLWNWLPNANYTNAAISDPSPSGLNVCQTGNCSTGEPNGRFADCYPQATGGSPPNDVWHAYNCPS